MSGVGETIGNETTQTKPPSLLQNQPIKLGTQERRWSSVLTHRSCSAHTAHSYHQEHRGGRTSDGGTLLISWNFRSALNAWSPLQCWGSNCAMHILCMTVVLLVVCLSAWAPSSEIEMLPSRRQISNDIALGVPGALAALGSARRCLSEHAYPADPNSVLLVADTSARVWGRSTTVFMVGPGVSIVCLCVLLHMSCAISASGARVKQLRRAAVVRLQTWGHVAAGAAHCFLMVRHGMYVGNISHWLYSLTGSYMQAETGVSRIVG